MAVVMRYVMERVGTFWQSRRDVECFGEERRDAVWSVLAVMIRRGMKRWGMAVGA